ncbi:MAG: hypothetical protein QOG58_941 [Caballeronia sp.]|nr:hypothetical protein [Caballeronia sp.]
MCLKSGALRRDSARPLHRETTLMTVPIVPLPAFCRPLSMETCVLLRERDPDSDRNPQPVGWHCVGPRLAPSFSSKDGAASGTSLAHSLNGKSAQCLRRHADSPMSMTSPRTRLTRGHYAPLPDRSSAAPPSTLPQRSHPLFLRRDLRQRADYFAHTSLDKTPCWHQRDDMAHSSGAARLLCSCGEAALVKAIDVIRHSFEDNAR